jgi:predicted naringenin-chalcone synthase
LSKIISIGTAVPDFQHKQEDIMAFMQHLYQLDEVENRKLRFLYRQGGISYRNSCIPDYGLPLADWSFFPKTADVSPFPTIEDRMNFYLEAAPRLSVEAIRNCLGTSVNIAEITHLITVSCTGMSAPGLDLQIMEILQLDSSIFRTSVNFMGCYAAVHALKLADALCAKDKNAMVLIVCTELCTLHLQKEPTPDNIASGLLFADGSAAALVTNNHHPYEGLSITSFYSEVINKGKNDMAWAISSTGFQMTLSGYVPDLIKHDIHPLIQKSLAKAGISKEDVTYWCIHPGGKKIVEAIAKVENLSEEDTASSYQVLNDYGNMSSATLLFVLKNMVPKIIEQQSAHIFGVAFGPGLTMESIVLSWKK